MSRHAGVLRHRPSIAIVLAIFVLSAATCAAARAASDGLTISGNGTGMLIAGHSYSFTPSTKDPSGHKLVFAIANKPAWATFNSSTGQLSGTPGTPSIGWYYNIAIAVSDGVSTAALPKFAIVVYRPDTFAPVISGTPATVAKVGAAYAFQPAVTNPSGNPLNFYVKNIPTWANFSYRTGQLTGTPTAANVGTYAGIAISASDGQRSASLPAFTLTVQPTTTGTDVVKISGTPPTAVTAGNPYSFTPTASDSAGRPLSFSVQNKPAWAGFSISNGALSGTPTTAQTGTYGNVIISASDGTTSTALAPFAINVTAATGQATLAWTDPTQNTNGTSLTNFAGVRVYYGPSASSLTHLAQVAGSANSYTITNLAPGTWYFALMAYTTTGVQSAMSSIVSKTIQ